MMKKVSVIIPAYNEEKYIGNTLKSLRDNDYIDKEIIVVANGCTDKTAEIARKYADKVIVLDEPNVCKARNLGADNAEGDLLVFLDSDIVLDGDVLKTIAGSGETLGTIKMRPDSSKVIDHVVQSFRNVVNWRGHVSGLLFCTKKDFLKAGGFDERSTVREFKPLIDKLKSSNRFRVLDVYGVNNYRRFRAEGYLNNILFWLGFVMNNKSDYKAVR